jgi:hypothetical protein
MTGTGSASLLSNELKQELVAFCSAHTDIDLGVTVHSIEEAADSACINVLKAASSLIKTGRSRGGTANTGGGGGGGTRGGTAGLRGEREQALLERVKDLESELKLALGAAEDIRALKAKLLQLVDRVRMDKEAKMRVQRKCIECSADFTAKISPGRPGTGKTCSVRCRMKYLQNKRIESSIFDKSKKK